MEAYFVCREEELGEGERQVVSCDGREVGIFRVGGEVHAWHNRCAHMRGPVCQGRIYRRVLEPIADDGTVRMLQHSEEELHIVCPWHGYEFNLRTGQHPGAPDVRLRRAQHEVRDGGIYVLV